MLTNICPKGLDPNFHLRRARENVWVEIEHDLKDYQKQYCVDVELARKLMEHILVSLVERQAPFNDSENFYKNVQLCIDVLECVEDVLMLNIRQDNRTKREKTIGDVVDKLQKITVM